MWRVSNLEASDLVHPDQTTSCTVIEKRENVRFKKEEKKRLRKKSRETAKEIDVAGHLGT